MKGFSLLFFLVTLISFSSREVIAQSEEHQTKIDSLKKAITIEKEDKPKYKLLRALSNHIATVDRDAASQHFIKQLEFAKQIKRPKYIAESNTSLGNNYLHLGDTESAFPFITKAIELYNDLDDKGAIANNLNSLALLYQRSNEYEKAAQTYQDVISYNDSLGDNAGKVYALINLMTLSTDQDDERKALEYAAQIDEIIELFPDMKDSEVKEIQGLLSAIYFNVGLCYNRLNVVDSARLYFEKALNDLKYLEDDYTISTYKGYIDNGLGEAYRMSGEEKRKKNSASTAATNDFTEALKYYNLANLSFAKLKDQRGIAFTLVNKGDALNQLGRHSEARVALEKSLALSQEIGFKEEERDSYEQLAENAEQRGDFQSSVRYYKQYFTAHESIRNDERDKAQKELETKYETVKKSKELEEERSANLVNQAKLTQQKYLLWLGLLIFAGIAYAIFARLRHKKQQEVRKYEQDMNKAMSRFIPTGFLNALGRDKITDVKLGDQIEKGVTVVFTDIRSFTTISEGMTPQENFAFVREDAQRMGPIIERNGGFISQYLGDGIMAIFQDNPASALMACLQMQEDIDEYNVILESRGRKPIKVGMGMHTGPLVMGIIGDDLRWDATLISDTVNTASRIESTTKNYEADILLSHDTASQIQDLEDYNLNPIGELTVKGKTIPIEIYECISYSKKSAAHAVL